VERDRPGRHFRLVEDIRTVGELPAEPSHFEICDRGQSRSTNFLHASAARQGIGAHVVSRGLRGTEKIEVTGVLALSFNKSKSLLLRHMSIASSSSTRYWGVHRLILIPGKRVASDQN
jgi:hypothetical protein